MSSTFETYFSLAEIAQRIPKWADFWRAEVKAGRFSPGGDVSNCVKIGGEYFVPASGVAFYLDSHRLGAAPLAALLNGRHRQPTAGREVLSAGGIKARSPGELRRVVQTHGPNGLEAHHG